MAYGSQIERIADQSAGASLARAQETSQLIRMFMNAQRSSRAPASVGSPVGMNAGPHNPARIHIGKGVKGTHGKVRPNAPIVTIRDGQGHSVQVNKSVADEVKGFLRALKRTGYDIDSIGGYANRNIAGTSTRSLHSYGLAIDINPSANPVYYGSRRNMTENLPRGIGRLARRYGMVWGGNWHGSKKDPMHFSFPKFGTK